MNKFDLEENVTNQADSQWLKESGLMEGIEPDKYWCNCIVNANGKPIGWILRDLPEDYDPDDDLTEDFLWNMSTERIACYRLDKLLAILPEFEIEFKPGVLFNTVNPAKRIFVITGYEDGAKLGNYLKSETRYKFHKAWHTLVFGSGQEAIKAAVALIRLLKEENLLVQEVKE